MKFPGKRKSKHYFPVGQKGRIPFQYDFARKGNTFIVGIDQLIVDIEAKVSDQFIIDHGFIKGQSVILDDQRAEEIYHYLKENQMVIGEYPGGAIGNTLHNFSVLSDTRSVLLGVINKNITVGDYAYNYICNTCSMVDLSHLQPVEGPMGKAICLITEDGERTFAVAKGRMNDLNKEYVKPELVSQASLLLITAFLLRDAASPIYAATLHAVEIAKANNVPVVLSLGTTGLVEENRPFLQKFVQDYVNILAMNDSEAFALTGEKDPLLAGQICLDWADMALITVGKHGLYLCAHVDRACARLTKDKLHSKAIPEYNKYEYSRPMLRRDCQEPIKIYTHINPYMGGPLVITNTNGAGDAALAALLHDLTANDYHREVVPFSPKHSYRSLSYSSLSQISKYANRVSYEVLVQNSPRLLCGLPEREDSLEESYWER